VCALVRVLMTCNCCDASCCLCSICVFLLTLSSSYFFSPSLHTHTQARMLVSMCACIYLSTLFWLCWVASHDEHANHCLIHLTCIIPPIGQKALPPDELKKNQDEAAAKDKDTIERWEELFDDRKQNKRFNFWVLKEIAQKQPKEKLRLTLPDGVLLRFANKKELEVALQGILHPNPCL
jgi:hypothetical protein